jgi:Asp-tRNA(Asn)/Glu-tRNA(Gln) amidotransferase A subunit family amidase
VHDYYLSQSTLGILAAGIDELGYTLAALFEGAGSDPGVVLPADPADGAQAGGPPSRVGLLAPLAWEQADSAARQALLDHTAQWQRAGVDVVTDDAALRELNALLRDTLPLTRKINAYESRPYLEAIAARDRDGLSPFALQRIADGQGIGRAEYHDAVQERAGLRRAFAKLSERYSAFVTLSAGGIAPVGTASTGDPAMSAMASILGCPAISLPLCELDGLPLGVQLIGRYGSDFDLLSLARWVVDVNRPTPSSVPT